MAVVLLLCLMTSFTTNILQYKGKTKANNGQKCLPSTSTNTFSTASSSSTDSNKDKELDLTQRASYASSRMSADSTYLLYKKYQNRKNSFTAKLRCRTETPRCLNERKNVVLFSEEFDVDLYYTLHRSVISLLCRVSFFLFKAENRLMVQYTICNYNDFNSIALFARFS